MTAIAQNNEQLMTRWIVEEEVDKDFWVPWCCTTHMYRFFSLKSAKEHYKEHKKDFHYAPCKYRYVQIIIQPERIIKRLIEEEA